MELPADLTIHAERGGYHACAPEWSLPRRSRPHTQCWVISGGTAHMTVAGRTVPLTAGTVVTIPPLVPQSARHDPRDPLRCHVIHVSARVLGAVVPGALAAIPLQLRPSSGAWPRIVASAAEVCHELEQNLPASALAANAAAASLVTRLWREAATQGLLAPKADGAGGGKAAQGADRAEAKRIAAVLDYVTWHSAERITLADLAGAAHVSRAHLSTIFRRATGMAPFEYLHRHRMRCARDLLETTQLTVAEVAAAVGLPDPYYFSRAFKRSEGVAPTAFREAKRQAEGP